MEKAKILIVEDEAIIAMEVESQLQSLGYQVTSVVDTGEKAIKKAEEEKPDLILMDIRIKGEMDGIETAEEIRNKFGIPVIFSTAYLDQERIERAKITMPFGYVLKPILERDLRVTIEMALYVLKVDSERRKVETTLRESEKKYHLLLDLTHDGLIVTKNSVVIQTNNALLNMLGLDDPSEIIGTNAIKWIDPESHDLIKSRISQLLTKTEKLPVAKYRIIRKDGVLRDVEAQSVSMQDQNGEFSLAVLRDVTERKQAEEEREVLKKRLQDVMDK
jgi:PAS domain S-box-containing protein